MEEINYEDLYKLESNENAAQTPRVTSIDEILGKSRKGEALNTDEKARKEEYLRDLEKFYYMLDKALDSDC